MTGRERGGRPPGVTKDEVALFRRAMGEVKHPSGKNITDESPSVKERRKLMHDPGQETHAPRSMAARSDGDLPELRLGQMANVDRRTAERLRRGKLVIDDRIDLHHHTQDEAHRALTQFILGASGAGCRCVLIITGKGAVSQGGGVLRRQVPHWLNLPPLRPCVLAISQAKPEHGGAGALYVLLRRRRQ